jgi:ankyrin repeat protein
MKSKCNLLEGGFMKDEIKLEDNNFFNEEGDTPLHWAVRHNFSDMVRTLLKRGASPNVKNKLGETSLMLAVKYGHRSLLPLLFNANIKFNLEDIFVMTSYLKSPSINGKGH